MMSDEIMYNEEDWEIEPESEGELIEVDDWEVEPESESTLVEVEDWEGESETEGTLVEDDDWEIEPESVENLIESESEETEEITFDDVVKSAPSRSSILNIDSSKFSVEVKEVSFKELTYSNPLKNYRRDTFKGLTTSVAELGIVTPIHVMKTEAFQEFLKEGNNEEDYQNEKYLLIDGFRRVFAGVKNGLNKSLAVVWDFQDAEMGRDVSVNLSLVLNKSQKHTWKEVWEMFEVLELSDVVTPSSLEYLLQLESGDAMKLKDVMLSEYDEVKEDLISEKKTLYQAYNMLQKLRKEEDKLLMEDNKGISVTEAGEAVADDLGKPRLSDSEVRDVLDLIDNDDIKFSDDNFGEWSGENISDNWQDRKNGDRIDENLRQSILERDRFTCQVSGFGKGLPTHYTRKLLRVHHIVFVQDGGTDSEENLITLTSDVHDLLHIIVANNGKLGISKEAYDELDEGTKEMYKKLMKYVNIALEAKERLGKKGSDDDYVAEKKDPFWKKMESEA
jgi:HNH endonuclease